ncbi:MAG: hypothetical protein ACK5O5_00645, partial [bacterium]
VARFALHRHHSLVHRIAHRKYRTRGRVTFYHQQFAQLLPSVGTAFDQMGFPATFHGVGLSLRGKELCWMSSGASGPQGPTPARSLTLVSGCIPSPSAVLD